VKCTQLETKNTSALVKHTHTNLAETQFARVASTFWSMIIKIELENIDLKNTKYDNYQQTRLD